MKKDIKNVLYVVFENRGHSFIDVENLEKNNVLQRYFCLSGLEKLAKMGIKNQKILISDELLCCRCRADLNVEKASCLIVSLSNSNNVMLAWDDAQKIPKNIRKLLRERNICYENGTPIPLENRYPWK